MFKMITISLKWLSGDLTSIEVPKSTAVYQLARLATEEPLYKVSFFREGGDDVVTRVVPHHKKLKESETLCIVVADPPRSVLVYKNIIDMDVYYSSDIETAHQFSLDKVKEFGKIYVDYTTFPYNTQREELCQTLLQMSAREHCCHLGMRIFRSNFLAKQMDDEIRLLWKDFMVSLYFQLPEELEEFCFPTLTTELKRTPLTPKEWASYCIIQK
jgi:hypothetical protein